MSAQWPQGRLGDLLGVRYPIVQGPFGGGLSSVRLAAAVSDAGGLGSYGGHHLPPDDLTDLVKRLRAATDGPFAVNLWVPQPGEDRDPSTEDLATTLRMLRPYLRELDLPEPRLPLPRGPRFEAQLDGLLDARPPVISFVMGLLPPEAVERAWLAGAFPALVREVPELRRTLLAGGVALGSRRRWLIGGAAMAMLVESRWPVSSLS